VGKRDFKSNQNLFIPSRNYKIFITNYIFFGQTSENKLELELNFKKDELELNFKKAPSRRRPTGIWRRNLQSMEIFSKQ